ncbi:uncharacterized protein [Clytia hemisphaerica]|uniref:uncharacterized protein n=1 Tax=Clytia hemisphaerica TaxID=252671 RepID=UPI0034D43E3F
MVKRGEKEDDLPDAEQCSTRFDTIRKPYKKAKNHNRLQSGGSPKKSKFFDELDEVLGGQPKIEPRITISSCGEVMTSEKTNSNKTKSPKEEDDEDDEIDSDESSDDSDDERKADEDVDRAELTLKERKRRKSKKDKKRKRGKYVPAAVTASNQLLQWMQSWEEKRQE